jgi:hypothetical protein
MRSGADCHVIDPKVLYAHANLLTGIQKELRSAISTLRKELQESERLARDLCWWANQIEVFEVLRGKLEGDLREPYEALLAHHQHPPNDSWTIGEVRSRAEEIRNQTKILQSRCSHGIGSFHPGTQEYDWDQTYHDAYRICYICGIRESERIHGKEISAYPFRLDTKACGYQLGDTISSIVERLHTSVYTKPTWISINL